MSATQPTVIVFTTPSCSYCGQVKSYLRQNKINFREVDISKDPAAARDLQSRTGAQSVPVILVNGRPVIGFKKEELNRLLNIKPQHGPEEQH